MKKFIKRVNKTLSEKRLTTVAGAWVYYFLTAVIPLVFLLLTAFGVFGVDITKDLASRLPEEFRPASESIINTAQTASKGATLLFVFSAIYSCIRLLNQMGKDGEHIYAQKSMSKRGAMRYLFAFFAIVVLFLIFLVCSFAVAFGENLFSFSFLVDDLRELLTAVSIAFSVIFVSFVIIILLNLFISPIKLKVGQVALGSLFSLFAVVLGTLGFAIYLRLFNSYNAFYGSLAGIIVFLLWTYIIMISMVIGVIINANIFRKRSLS